MSRNRYEKEIEKILEKAGEDPSNQPDDGPNQAPHRRSPSTGRIVNGRSLGLKFQYALIAGVALIVLGAVLNWLYFFFAGIALVAVGYIIYYRSPRGRGGGGVTRTPRMWRGRSIDEDDPPGDWRRR